MPEHIDSENWWKNEHKIPDDADIVVTQKLHGCVSYDTLIDTDHGQKTIKDIVENRLLVKVKSMDVKSNEILYSEIGEYFYKKDDGDWYEIELENGQTIKITGNNPVWLPDLGCYRKVEELTGEENLLVL